MKARVLKPIQRVIVFFVEVVEDFFDDDCSQRAAALAYYATLSLPALLVVLLAFGGAIIDPAVVESAVQRQAERLVAGSAAEQIVQMVQRAAGWASSGPWWAIALSIGGLLFGATRAFSQLQMALNRAWAIDPPTNNLIKAFVIKRLFSFAALGVLTVLFLMSITIRALFTRFHTFAVSFVAPPLLLILEWLSGHSISIVFGTVFFASLYWLLPDAKVPWRAVIPGAVFTALSFEALNSLLSAYLGSSQLDHVFGQAGSFVVLLTWLYACASLFLFGAEFSQVWSRHRRRWPGILETPRTQEKPVPFSKILQKRWRLKTHEQRASQPTSVN